MYTLYKVYYPEGLAYIGRTVQPLARRLKDHYCRKHRTKELSRACIVKVEYAICKSLSDLYVYEVFYINLLKPTLNVDDKAPDMLNLKLPELHWFPFDDNLSVPTDLTTKESDNETDKRPVLPANC